MSYKAFRASAAFASLAIAAPAYVSAAPVITAVNANLLSGPISFSFMGGSFTFAGMNTFPDYISVSTGVTPTAAAGTVAAVRTVFGSPSTDFTNRNTVVYDQNTSADMAHFRRSPWIGPRTATTSSDCA